MTSWTFLGAALALAIVPSGTLAAEVMKWLDAKHQHPEIIDRLEARFLALHESLRLYACGHLDASGEATLWETMVYERTEMQRLHRELQVVMTLPEVKAYFAEAGIEIVASTPAQMDSYFREERDHWARVVKESGAKID